MQQHYDQSSNLWSLTAGSWPHLIACSWHREKRFVQANKRPPSLGWLLIGLILSHTTIIELLKRARWFPSSELSDGRHWTVASLHLYHGPHSTWLQWWWSSMIVSQHLNVKLSLTSKAHFLVGGINGIRCSSSSSCFIVVAATTMKRWQDRQWSIQSASQTDNAYNNQTK